MVNITVPKLSFGFFRKKSVFFSTVFGILTIVMLSIGGYFAYQYFTLKQSVQDPKKANIKELEYIVDKVGKLVELPQGEQPLLATVNDVSKLMDKPFFKHAQNGDKALFYAKAQKAILYRPSTNKIIEIGPYIVPTVTPTKVESATPEASMKENTKLVTVSLLNGTSISGLAKTVESKLMGKVKNIEVVEKKDAAKKDYVKNLIIDLKGDQSQVVKDIQGALGGEIASVLPEGEATPEGSILVILGSSDNN